jgi:beta-carotene 3-hydroxylase
MNWFHFLLFFLTFFTMEFVAWFTHKFIMHGWLWSLHEDHHSGKNPMDFFERNDSFFLLFAMPGIACLALGSFYTVPYCSAIGLGITAYGFCYFLVHDVFIHRRFKWFRNSNHFYFQAIRKAHKMHHKHLKKEHGECFGMLIVPFHYYIQALKGKKK